MINKPAISRKEMAFLKNTTIWIAVVLLVFPLSVVTGCATTASRPSTNDPANNAANDPFEKTNRVIFAFNLRADRLILKPLAKGYVRVVPSPIRIGVSNVFSNLWLPMTVFNDVLQGKLGYAIRDTSRFVMNSTFGIFGIFDVATEANLPEHREDFGQTLAVWGMPSGPYLVSPFFGPSNLRDTGGLVPQFVHADAVSYMGSPQAYYARTLRLTDARAQLLGADDILDLQPDQYLFVRENYRQQRLKLIHDGKPPMAESDSEDGLIDQLLEDDL